MDHTINSVAIIDGRMVVKGSGYFDDIHSILKELKERYEPALRTYLRQTVTPHPKSTLDEDVNALIEEWGMGSLVMMEHAISFTINYQYRDYTLTIE